MDVMTWHNADIQDGVKHALMWNTQVVAVVVQLGGTMARWYRNGQHRDFTNVDAAKADVERIVARDFAQTTGQRIEFRTAVSYRL